MVDELTWTSARELRRLIADRQISPVDVVAACLARIEALDPTLHAFITVAGERALDDAKHAEAAVQRGDALGPLHGIPVALKDEAWTADIPSTGGSLLFKRFVPSHDGTVTERLRRAGAIVIGKTNMPEFAAWPRSKTRLAGESVNPWDITRISGASSGGSAAAVAAGMVPLAIGSDGGGSTRIPSAFCGVVRPLPHPGSRAQLRQLQLQHRRKPGADRSRRRRHRAAATGHRRTGSAGRARHHATRAGRRQRAVRLGGDDAAHRLVSRLRSDPRRSPHRGRRPGRVGEDGGGRRRRSRRSPAASSIRGATARCWPTCRPRSRPEAWNLDDADVDIPDTSPEQQWMWATFGGPVPLDRHAGVPSALCRRYRHLLTPPSQLTYQAPASAPACRHRHRYRPPRS